MAYCYPKKQFQPYTTETDKSTYAKTPTEINQREFYYVCYCKYLFVVITGKIMNSCHSEGTTSALSFCGNNICFFILREQGDRRISPVVQTRRFFASLRMTEAIFKITQTKTQTDNKKQEVVILLLVFIIPRLPLFYPVVFPTRMGCA